MHDSLRYRYPVEQTLIVGLTEAVCLAPSELGSAVDRMPELASFPLYLVARRPRVSMAARQDGEDMTITFRSASGLESTMVFERFEAEFQIEAGGQFFEIVHDGESVMGGRAGQLLTAPISPMAAQTIGERASTPLIDERLLDLEVLYIGMSADYEGATKRRLVAHSTLQQILADHLDRAPQYELWVIPMRFGATNTLSLIHGLPAEEEFDDGVVEMAVAAEFDREARIALAEAAAIRLFAPEYNTHYRANFPSLQHKRYASVFPAQYNALGITINTFDSVRCRLWSEARDRSFTHEAAWPLEPGARKGLATVDDILDLFRPAPEPAE